MDTIGGGEFKTVVYTNQADQSEHMALVKGDVADNGPVLVRMHAFNMFDDIYSAEKTLELHKAMEMINKEGRGAVVMLRNPSRTFISDRIQQDYQGPSVSFRGYGIGAQILLDLGIHEMIVLLGASSVAASSLKTRSTISLISCGDNDIGSSQSRMSSKADLGSSSFGCSECFFEGPGKFFPVKKNCV